MNGPRGRALPIALAVLPLLGFWLYGLFDLDEGFYAAVVSAMLRTGDWITPHYRGHPWFEKPILLYWAAAPFAKVFGAAWALRVPSVLANIGTYAICAASMRRNVGESAAPWTWMVLGTSLLVAALGRMMMTDALLVFFLTGAFLAHWESRDGSLRWRLAAAASLGFAVLAKGPVALLLFAPVAVLACWREPDLRAGFGRGWVLGGVVFAAVVATWYAPAYLANPDSFVQKFLIEQNIQRFAGGDAAHAVPLWVGLPLYPAVLLVGMLPWSLYAFRAFPSPAKEHPYEAYLATWFGVVLLFFTIGGSKLPHYIFPAAIPFGMLIARRLGRGEPARTPWGAVATSLVVAALLNVGFVLYYASGQAEVHRLAVEARALGRPVISYQMGRREKGLGTGQAKIQETSLPSLEYYVNRVVLEAETLDELEAKGPGIVITRVGRLRDRDFETLREQGWTLTPLEKAPPKNYRMFQLSRMP
ncbi:MAG: glycosyltransferase family 39 protein [Fimbriimonadaceae bacterium]|nr:glycosyltransferase family 39 protein [Fimbriimonadaceae bacterium]